MTGLSVISKIYSILDSNSDLKKMVGDRISPDITTPTAMPFIVMIRESVDGTYTKDGLMNDTTMVHIAIADNKYSREVEIAEKVREILDCYKDKDIKNCYMDSASEYSMNDAYVQELTFKVVL